MKKNKKNLAARIICVLFLFIQTSCAMHNQSLNKTVVVNDKIIVKSNSLLNFLLENNSSNPTEVFLLTILLQETEENTLPKKRTFDQMVANKALPVVSSKKQCLETPNINHNTGIKNTKFTISKTRYICTYDDCGKFFTTKSTLATHEKTHTKERLYLCTYDGCGKSFAQKSHLIDHERIHTGEKPYMCTYDACDKSFANQSNLNRHIKTHTGENHYPCTYNNCNKFFTRKDTLTRHEKNHIDEKPYICTYEGCGKSFKKKSNLINHQKIHEKQ